MVSAGLEDAHWSILDETEQRHSFYQNWCGKVDRITTVEWDPNESDPQGNRMITADEAYCETSNTNYNIVSKKRFGAWI
jgi:hypothetical protein